MLFTGRFAGSKYVLTNADKYYTILVNMKIEKINDNHIRCTLNAGDLLARKMKVSELAYGSEKAKMLFKDIMDQAGAECGFEADDIPLMIEAIPVSSECIVLNVIKVEDPEELDTRFSKFAPSVLNDEMSSEDGEFLLEDFFKRLGEEAGLGEMGSPAFKDTPDVSEDLKYSSVHVYAFSSLSVLIRAAHVLGKKEAGRNTLYKDQAENMLYLSLYTEDMSKEDALSFVNTLSEYGIPQIPGAQKDAYLSEHADILIKDNALKSLSGV